MRAIELKGTPAQVKWATTIRENGLSEPGRFTDEQVATLSRINDSTWWIANRDDTDRKVHTLRTDYKAPAPHQLEGGPPPPPRTKQQTLDYRNTLQKGIRDMESYAKDNPLPLLKDGVDPTDEPHEAELFAASVSHIPILAELALDAAMSRLYIKANAEIGRMMRHRVRLRMERIREDLIASIDKDLDGIRRIIGKD